MVGHSQGPKSPDDGSQPLSAFSILSFTPGQGHKHQVRDVVRTFALFPGTWLFGSCWEVPACLGLECGWPRQVHKLTFPPPIELLGAGRVAAPPRPCWAPGWWPPHPASIPLERAPASCDWLIQTHRHRNACLRVPVGVQFKSAALGARGRAGAGSADDSCAEASPGRPLVF